MDKGYFIDWVSVSQFHGEGTPDFVGSVHFRFDEDGEPDVESAGSRTLRGSHDTSLQVRSHRGWVTASGNPGRFGRPDNLFGLTLDECMAALNDELARVGLPGFTPGVELRPNAEDLADHRLPEWTGARFSRLDVTRGFETGSEFAARLCMRSYSRISMARMTRQVWGGETALWRTQRRTVKAYLKGPEMKAHGLGDSPWCAYATDRGIVRHELELRSKFLSETRLRYWGNASMERLIRLHVQETEHLQQPDSGHDPLAVERLPGRVRLTYAAWLKGENVRELLTRATFYRHRSTLLAEAGIDIQDPRDVGHFVEPRVRVIELRPAVAPAEYWLRAA